MSWPIYEEIGHRYLVAFTVWMPNGFKKKDWICVDAYDPDDASSQLYEFWCSTLIEFSDVEKGYRVRKIMRMKRGDQ